MERAMRATRATRLLCMLLVILKVSWASPPFWPEENCLNQVSTMDYRRGVGYIDNRVSPTPTEMNVPPFGVSSPAVNPYDAEFESFLYEPYQGPGAVPAADGSNRRRAGPRLNDTTTPCRLEAYVGVPMQFTVYAESLDPGGSVRIYVLEDPGIPNNAFVTADEPHQRCMPKDPAVPPNPATLGPCPMCQNSGRWTYGTEMLPASPADSLGLWLRNFTDTGQPCQTNNGCSTRFVPVQRRVWCMDPTGSRDYGNGKPEVASQHGRLRKRTFTWTPLEEQGICPHPTRCTFIVKFQAFDQGGQFSVIKEYQINVIKAAPVYSAGTIGLIVDGKQETFKDPVTSDESQVSSTTYQPQNEREWMVQEREYKAYINCPFEITMGLQDANENYDVKLSYASQAMAPAATLEWRQWRQACADRQSKDGNRDVWTDTLGRTCSDYVTNGWCKDGAQGPSFASLGGSFASHARDQWLPADRACCACGAGKAEETPCSLSKSQLACEDNQAAGEVKFPRQKGCQWDTGASVCRGVKTPYWVDAGVFSSAWSVAPTPPIARRVMAIFKWTPVRGMEGQRHQVCFQGSDAQRTRELEKVCAYVLVTKCHYCVRVGETLKYVAEQYNFDTNWLRLWNYNFQLNDPDMILRSFLPLRIGSTYKVQPGDTLARIAARLRTTVKKILEVNPDIKTPQIESNQEVCVMPCTEESYKDAPINPYNGAAINGVGAAFVEKVPRLSKDAPFVAR